MKTAYAALALVCAALLAGCSIPSLNGIYSEDKAVRDDGLLGTWVDEHDDITVTVTQSPFEQLLIEYSVKHNKEQPADALRLEARLVQLGEHRWVDLLVHEASFQAIPTTAMRLHQFMRVHRDGDTLQVWMPTAAMVKLLDAGESGLSFARVDAKEHKVDRVITSSTPDLQKFFTDHGGDETLLGEPFELKRKPIAPHGAR